MHTQNKFHPMGIPYSTIPGLENMNFLGHTIVRCPKCNTIWTRQFAPEFCFECGTRVMDKPGEGFKEDFDFRKRVGLPRDTFNCPKCGLEIPENIRDQMTECFRCYTVLDTQAHAGSKLPSIKFLIEKIKAKL